MQFSLSVAICERYSAISVFLSTASVLGITVSENKESRDRTPRIPDCTFAKFRAQNKTVHPKRKYLVQWNAILSPSIVKPISSLKSAEL